MCEETKHALTVVGRNTDDTFLGNGGAVVAGLTTRASHETATIEIDQYRQSIGCVSGCRPDIEIEAVLAATSATELHVAEDIELHGVVAKLFSLPDTLPSLEGLRGLPTEFAHRSLCKGNAQELLHAIFLEALENAILGFYLESDSLSFLLCASTKDCKTGDGKHRE